MTRFEKKVDCVLWTFILLLPFFVFFVSTFHNPSITDFSVVINNFKFAFIADLFNNIFIGDSVLPVDLVNYLSYFCVVQIAHVFVDAVCFIPRFSHNLLGGIYPREK